MYHKLQFISQGNTPEEHFECIRRALQGGCRWVQLRMKEFSPEQITRTAIQVRALCNEFGAVFIVNDHPAIAAETNADGVHLGLSDMNVSEARKIVGKESVIGGTANTMDDVLKRIKEECDYVGVGPFRTTSTKKNLSPLLGISGYSNICSRLQDLGHNIPLYAIGGIEPADVRELSECGVYGIAVSGAIASHSDPASIIKSFNEQLHAESYNSR